MTIDVLYIAGSGKSGSTFLSLMLSQHDRLFNIGQIRDLPDAFRKSSPCTCGKPVPNCAYWGPVVGQLVAQFGPNVLSEIADGLDAFGAASQKQNRWNRPKVRGALRSAHAPFLDRFGAMYRAAVDHAGGRMLVDSSKSVDLVLALTLLPDVNVHILNLIRDPRAVAVSWSKILKRPEVLKRRTRNWAGRQKRLAVLRDINADRFMQLRYEDLTSNPRHYIAQIQDWTGLDRDLTLFTGEDSAAIAWDRVHLFPPANATVLAERKETIRITPAQSWKAPKNAAIHDMAEQVTFPMAKSLGYKKGVI